MSKRRVLEAHSPLLRSIFRYRNEKKRKRMKQVKIRGIVIAHLFSKDIGIYFGRVQMEMSFSKRGSIQRALKLKKRDKIEVIIKGVPQ